MALTAFGQRYVFECLTINSKKQPARATQQHFQHIFTFLNRYERSKNMLNNTNKNNYIYLPKSANVPMQLEVKDWIAKEHSGFTKWASPFGLLESQCWDNKRIIDLEDYPEFQERSHLTACWRNDAPCYDGEIWRNEPDLVIEYVIYFVPNMYDEPWLECNWRIFLHKDFVGRDGNEWLESECVQAKLKADLDYSDDWYFRFFGLNWGFE
jgi:hypothetical protein